MSYIKTYFVTLFIVISLFLSIGIYIQPVDGDLARVGNLSERDFGWNHPQPALEILANDTTEPDIIVLGDSFSEHNYWQSEVSKITGKKILTFNWNRIGSPICFGSWLKVIQKRYPKTKQIIVQSVERHFITRFSREQEQCEIDNVEPVEVMHEFTQTTRTVDIAHIGEIMPDPIYAISAIKNSKLVEKNQLSQSGDTSIYALNKNNLFSNRLSNYLLTFEKDNQKYNWDQSTVNLAVKHMQSIIKDAKDKGINITYLLIPDKSTVYKGYVQALADKNYPNIWEEMDKNSVNHVRLDKPFEAASSQIVDFYKPDDTHLSTEGFKFLREILANQLTQ